jgi:hypothetical protein
MKTTYVAIFALLMTGATAAEQNHAGMTVPQPRVRLDPIKHTAIAEPKKEDKKASTDSVVAMSPFVVKAKPLDANETEQDRQPTGPFSPLTGGWIARKESSGTYVEFGVWPYRNILWKADRFKSDLKHVGTEFLRISW